MQEVPDVKFAERVEQRLETEGGKGVSKLLIVAFGIVTTTLLTLINVNVSASNANAAKAMAAAQAEHDVNAAQASDLALIKQRQDGFQKVSDATVASLQALTQSVLNNHDDIILLKQADATRVQHSRPGH
jgi:hypothetical protein